MNSTKPSAGEFNNLGIAPTLLGGVTRQHFTSPTPIQKESIPAGLRGDDIIAVAQTGSGKTIAFGIPMLQRLSQTSRGIGLVVVPTRELAIQVEESLRVFCRAVNFRSAVLIGGAPMPQQRQALKQRPRLIVATPGRLMDHIDRRTLSLSHVGVFVLDEADRMLDMGFIPDIKKIMKSLPDQRQTMLFSATMPEEIEAIGQQLTKNPTRVEIDRSGASPAEISHEMYFINNHDKSRLLALKLKQCSGPVLVFTRTKRMASKLTTRVNSMGFSTAEIHSNRSQGQRRNALEGFKRGKYQILVATDIAARGIDVSDIELVVNYDMPANSEDYVHRIGRTGRAGKTGRAVSFANFDQKGSIRSIERFMNTKLAISTLPSLPSLEALLKEADLRVSKNEAEGNRRFGRLPLKKSNPRIYGAKLRQSKRSDSKKPNRNPAARPSSSSKSKDSPVVDAANHGTVDGKSFWSQFKKKRSKKKSVGQGSYRKRRAKGK